MQGEGGRRVEKSKKVSGVAAGVNAAGPKTRKRRPRVGGRVRMAAFAPAAAESKAAAMTSPSEEPSARTRAANAASQQEAAAAERAAEKAARRNAATQLVLADRAADLDTKKKVAAAKAAARKAAAEKAAAERIEAERIEAERIEAERRELERLEAERVEANRVAAEAAAAEIAAAVAAAEEEARLAAELAAEEEAVKAAAHHVPDWVHRLLVPEYVRRAVGLAAYTPDRDRDSPTRRLEDPSATALSSLAHLHATSSPSKGEGGVILFAQPTATSRAQPTSRAAATSRAVETSGSGDLGGTPPGPHSPPSSSHRMAFRGRTPRTSPVRVRLAEWGNPTFESLERTVATVALVLREGLALDSQIIGKLPAGGETFVLDEQVAAVEHYPDPNHDVIKTVTITMTLTLSSTSRWHPGSIALA